MRQFPTLLAALTAVLVATPAWAWGGSTEGGGGGKDGKGGMDCCAPDGKGGHEHGHDGKSKDGKGDMDCCGPEGDKDGRKNKHEHEHRGYHEHHGDKDMHDGHGRHGMHDGKGEHRGMRGMHGRRMGDRSHELRYMPATSGNQHLVLAWDRRKAKGEWFSMGFQGNYALQLAPAPGMGNWFTPYWGLLPMVGTSVGNVRLDAGALLGVGAMMRTTGATAGTPGDFLQLRPMWVVEPRVELGFNHGAWRMGLVGTYALSPNPAEFSGPSVGLKVGFGGPRHRD